MSNTGHEVYNLRNTHSVSLQGHYNSTCDKRFIHERDVMKNRAPALPAAYPDVSVLSVGETLDRLTVHQRIYTSDKRVFAKSESEDTKLKYANALQGVHLLKDPGLENKKFTYARIPAKPYPEVSKPAEDFNHTDTSDLRSTGYSSGHVRSILRLDVTGPIDSKSRNSLLIEGRLPTSPNIDRYQNGIGLLSEYSSLASQSHNSLTSRSSNNLSQSLVGANKNTLPGTLGYYGPALIADDVQIHIPFHKSKTWFTSYQNYLKNKEMKKVQIQTQKVINDEIQKESNELKYYLDDFDRKLKYKKMKV